MGSCGQMCGWSPGLHPLPLLRGLPTETHSWLDRHTQLKAQGDMSGERRAELGITEMRFSRADLLSHGEAALKERT